jgi:hypothetical protein
MTCIVAIAQNGTVYMGSDHAASDDKTGWILSRKEPKCFKTGQYAIAFTDSFRMGQILQYSWTPPKYTPTKTNSGLDKFMRTKFIDSVKQAFKDHGYDVGENVVNYMAEGSGGQIALGALYATKNQKNPRLRIKAALEAAAEFNMSVAPPFTYIQV